VRHIHEHDVFLHHLRGMTIDGPNQVWCADITYLSMQRGFLYLVAVMDWAMHEPEETAMEQAA
jgi:putative transposase